MKILDKYQTKQLALGFAFIGIILMVIIWLTQSLRIMDMIITNGISFGAFIKLTTLLLPNFIVIISPIVIFVVSLFCYSRMSLDRELHVLRSIGMSSLRISKPALKFALLITILNYAMVFYFIPTSFSEFRELQWKLRYDLSNVLIKEGELNSLDKNLNIFVKERDSQGNLYGIMINDNRTAGSRNTTLAQKGALLNSAGAPKVIMENGVRQENSIRENKFSTLYFDQYLIDFDIMSKDSSQRFRNAKERFIWELLTVEKGGRITENDIRKFRVEAHSRIAKPLYNLLFCIIASVGILGTSFNRHGQNKAIIISIGLMVIFQSLQIALENIATKNLTLVPIVYLNVLIPLAVGTYVLKNDNLQTALYKMKGKFKKLTRKRGRKHEA